MELAIAEMGVEEVARTLEGEVAGTLEGEEPANVAWLGPAADVRIGHHESAYG